MCVFRLYVRPTSSRSRDISSFLCFCAFKLSDSCSRAPECAVHRCVEPPLLDRTRTGGRGGAPYNYASEKYVSYKIRWILLAPFSTNTLRIINVSTRTWTVARVNYYSSSIAPPMIYDPGTRRANRVGPRPRATRRRWLAPLCDVCKLPAHPVRVGPMNKHARLYRV